MARAQLSSFDAMASVSAFLLILLVSQLVWDSLLVTIREKETKEDMQMVGERALDFLAAPGSPITSERYVIDDGKLASLSAQANNATYAAALRRTLGVSAYNLTLEVGTSPPQAFPNASYSLASSRAVSVRPFLYEGGYAIVRVVVWK